MRMKKFLKSIQLAICSVLFACNIALVVAPASPAFADAKSEVCNAIGDTPCTGGQSRISGVIEKVINLLSAIGGIIAVIMVIIGGVKYVTSSGDSNSASSARNTILYAVIGLIIIAFSQVLVRFVLQQT
jgi:hypothetical protein